MASRWFANEPAVFADEGGLRCVVEDVARYVPFASIENALLTPALDAYRARAMDTQLLEQTLADTTDEIEARAAAAHALMKVGRRDAVAPLVGALSPPMVIAAVRLAKGGETVVSDELLEQALPFLGLRDRVVFQERSRDALRPNGSPKGTGAA